MPYDFDTPIDRRGTDSIKWAKYAGKKSASGEDIIPMWVADMDFAAPPEVIAALQKRIAHGVFGYGHTANACACHWMNTGTGPGIWRRWKPRTRPKPKGFFSAIRTTRLAVCGLPRHVPAGSRPRVDPRRHARPS